MSNDDLIAEPCRRAGRHVNIVPCDGCGHEQCVHCHLNEAGGRLLCVDCLERLYRAAPDLLEALRKLVAEVERVEGVEALVLDEARAALSEAQPSREA